MIHIFNPILPNAFGTQMSYLELLRHMSMEINKEIDRLDTAIENTNKALAEAKEELQESIQKVADDLTQTRVELKALDDKFTQNIAEINETLSQHEEHLSTLDSNMNDINTELEAHETRMDELQKTDEENRSLIDANTADITTNRQAIASNADNISANRQAIEDNATAIQKNADDIATNKADIATNKADIATNKADIATNTAGIATNKADIATNQADITVNASNIAVNTADIGDLKLSAQDHATAIQKNADDIATNKADIATNTNNIANNSQAIDAIELELQELKTSTLNLYVKTDIYEAGQKAQDDNINQNMSDIADLQTNVTNAENDINGLRTDVDELQTDVSGVKSNIDSIQLDLQDLKTSTLGLYVTKTELDDSQNAQNSMYNSQLNGIRHQLDYNSSHISAIENSPVSEWNTDLSGQITGIDDRVTALEAGGGSGGGSGEVDLTNYVTKTDLETSQTEQSNTLQTAFEASQTEQNTKIDANATLLSTVDVRSLNNSNEIQNVKLANADYRQEANARLKNLETSDTNQNTQITTLAKAVEDADKAITEINGKLEPTYDNYKDFNKGFYDQGSEINYDSDVYIPAVEYETFEPYYINLESQLPVIAENFVVKDNTAYGFRIRVVIERIYKYYRISAVTDYDFIDEFLKQQLKILNFDVPFNVPIPPPTSGNVTNIIPMQSKSGSFFGNLYVTTKVETNGSIRIIYNYNLASGQTVDAFYSTGTSCFTQVII